MKRSPLKKMGKDKARETRKYWPLRRKFMEAHPFCEFPTSINSEDYGVSCVNRTTSIHHMKGQQGQMMNDTAFWMATCVKHHAWIEEHKNKARKMGLILYK